MSEISLEDKQRYLRSEILDKGFDGQEFFNYLTSLKGEQGGDLNNWDFQELQNTVVKFQNSHTSINSNTVKENTNLPLQNTENQINNNINNNQQNDINNDKNQINNNINNNQQNDINNDKNHSKFEKPHNEGGFDRNINLQNYINPIQFDTSKNSDNENKKNENTNSNINTSPITEINCLGPENSELLKYNELKFTLSFPEKKSESSGFFGLFSKKIYFTYLIQTSPINLSVRRRYADFEWLRATLTNLYPGIYIPPIPLKTLSENASDNKVEKRMNTLQKFLNELLKNPVLKGSPLLYEFVSIQREELFIEKKKNYSNIKYPSNLSAYRSRTGKIIIDKTLVKDNKFFEGLKYNLVSNSAELTNLINSYKLLFKEMKQVSTRMYEIANIYQKLYALSIKNSEEETLIKSYAVMEKLMKDWGYSELKTSTNIELKIREYFKYLKLEYNSMKELYDRFEYTSDLFMKSNEKLYYKKEELFRNGLIEKWELTPGEQFDFSNKRIAFEKMLPQETAKVQFLKQLFHYYANCCKEEFNRFRIFIGQQNHEAYNDFYNQNLKIIEELNKSWELFHER